MKLTKTIHVHLFLLFFPFYVIISIFVCLSKNESATISNNLISNHMYLSQSTPSELIQISFSDETEIQDNTDLSTSQKNSYNLTKSFSNDFSIDENNSNLPYIEETKKQAQIDSSSKDITEYFNTSSDTIHIPSGEYDGKGKIITLKGAVTIYGDGSDNTIIKNISFISTHSIIVKNLSIDNAASINTWTHSGENSNTKTFFYIFRPANYITIDYENCNFSNADYVSFVNGTNTMKSDTANNCNFSNIKRVAIYHAINSQSSTYTNNTFKMIGDSTLTNGMVSAIWIGDIQNITYAHSNYVNIDNNTMHDLYTADDPSLSRHIINANFIAIRADHASITNNTISNIHGYGEDREGIYTKVKYLTIKNNTLTDAGFGEGYICCKGQDDANSYSIINENIIKGKYGSGIYLYGPGEIKSNQIELTNCEAAIICKPRETSQSAKKLTVASNAINCSIGYYYLNSKKMTNHFSNYLVNIDGSKYETIVRANNVTCNNEEPLIKGIIRIGNVAKNSTSTYNIIYSRVPNCIALMINSNENYCTLNKTCTINASNNILTSKDYGIQIIMKNKDGTSSQRTYIIEYNRAYVPSTYKYGIYLNAGNDNNDTLTFFSSEYAAACSHIYAKCKNLSSPSALITLAK